MSDYSQIRTVIIGAGPFGLSMAAHLRAASEPFRIFGMPMHRWLYQMPRGMFLKSEGHASSLSEPSGRYTLARFCAENRLPYDDRALPVSIETFIEYALSFQREFVPSLEQVMVSQLRRSPGGFELELENGESVRAGNVIVATGLDHATFLPNALAQLPPDLASHSSDHRDFGRFQGKDVSVIGGGQSALETAALLAEVGARVRVIVRRPSVQWNSPPSLGYRSIYRRVRYPLSQLGEGLLLWTFCKAPDLFYELPRRYRIARVRTVLSAAGAWWLRSRVEGKIDILAGQEVSCAEPRGGRLVLRTYSNRGKQVSEFETDHVIAATGYRYDVRRLPFLAEDIKRALRTEDHRPRLSHTFESDVPGLYFVGMASAYAFGPPMRFVAGVRHTAHALAAHLSAERSRRAEQQPQRIASLSN